MQLLNIIFEHGESVAINLAISKLPNSKLTNTMFKETFTIVKETSLLIH